MYSTSMIIIISREKLAAMNVLTVCSTSFPLTHKLTTLKRAHHAKAKPMVLNPKFNHKHTRISCDFSSSISAPRADRGRKKFDWYSNWYPLMPVCDLDKRVPQGKRVLGLDVVVWWDRNENAWKVFDDICPHRLAPLSEGRIDEKGRLQCVYHGWCFDGSGHCKLIPQAPLNGAPVHTSKRARAAAYPCTVQHDVVWFWPSTDPEHKDIVKEKRPPYIPKLDDPSFSHLYLTREIPYGYELLIENFMDPAHVTYAHYGQFQIITFGPNVEVDKEGGQPIGITLEQLDTDGFSGKLDWGQGTKFIAPCIFQTSSEPIVDEGNRGMIKRILPVGNEIAPVFMCVPVSPGKSRLIWAFPRNFSTWIDKVVPRWMIHIGQNLVLDSDLIILHFEEHRLMEAGKANWLKACFTPTKSDVLVVAFRRWLKKYAGGKVDWKGKYTEVLPPSPPREQLMDRYKSHVVNCRSCSVAYKGLKALDLVLQILTIGCIGIAAMTEQIQMPVAARAALVSAAIICFAAAKFLGHFVHTTFHFHDYNHSMARVSLTVVLWLKAMRTIISFLINNR